MAGVRQARSWDRRRSRPRFERGRGRVWVLLGCLGVCLALIVVFSVRGVRISGLQRRLVEAERAHQAAVAERAALDARLAQKDDLSVIEDEARRQLGWILPGEIRVVFVDGAEEEE